MGRRKGVAGSRAVDSEALPKPSCFTRGNMAYVRTYITECLSHRFSNRMRTHLKLPSRCQKPGTLTSLATKQTITLSDTALRPTRVHDEDGFINLSFRDLSALRVLQPRPPFLLFSCFELKLCSIAFEEYAPIIIAIYIGNASSSSYDKGVSRCSYNPMCQIYPPFQSFLQSCNIATLIHSCSCFKTRFGPRQAVVKH